MDLDIRTVGVSKLWDLLKPQETAWRFLTSDGLEVAFGVLPAKFISLGLAGGHFFVHRARQQVYHSMSYKAASVGLGVGTPISIAHSKFEWPAQGWGNIWKIPLTKSDNPPDTFMGPVLMYSVSASVTPLVSSGLGAKGATVIFLGGNELALQFPTFVGFYKYVGIIYGSFAATPGAGATLYAGLVHAKEQLSCGEDKCAK